MFVQCHVCLIFVAAHAMQSGESILHFGLDFISREFYNGVITFKFKTQGLYEYREF